MNEQQHNVFGLTLAAPPFRQSSKSNSVCIEHETSTKFNIAHELHWCPSYHSSEIEKKKKHQNTKYLTNWIREADFAVVDKGDVAHAPRQQLARHIATL
jgi:hypothetical protein